ncbi:MAG: PqqD family protein [Armatimonadota bacterium]
MGAWGRVLEKLRLRKSPPQLTRRQSLEALPLRNPSLDWRDNDSGEVVVTLPRRTDLRGRVVSLLFYVPKQRDITLDEVGSRVWHLCDGEHSVEDIVSELAGRYKLSQREAEVGVTEYLRLLGKRGMVGFAVEKGALDADADEPEEEQPPKKRRRRRKRKKRDRS